MQLTKQQEEIVSSRDQHIMCIANAGTGKSTVIVERVADLVKQGVFDPSRILLSSFSVMANKELRDKIRERMGIGVASQVNVRTIHSLCYKILLEHRPLIGYKEIDIISAYKYAKYLHDAARNVGIEISMKGCYELSGDIEDRKRNGTIKHLNDENAQLFEIAEQRMFDQDEMTYIDILWKTNQILMGHPLVKQRIVDRFDYVIIDECQDTDLMQWNIIENILGPNTHTMMVGDVKQNIYVWRGASYKYMDAFRKRHESTIYNLTETFRFGKDLASASNILIENMDIDDIYKQKTVTNVSINKKPEYSACQAEEAVIVICDDIEKKLKQGYNYKDLNVLYRVNKDSLPFQAELAKRKIPFHVQRGSFLDRREIKFLINCVELLYKFSMDSLINVFNSYSDFVNIKTLDNVSQMYEGNDTFDFLYLSFSGDIKGIGKKRKKAFRELYHKFIDLRTFADSEEFNFSRAAEIMQIDNASFMAPGVNTTGTDNNQERWEFIRILQSFYKESGLKDIREFINFLKLDYQTSEEVNEKNAVNLKTIHGSKGQTLPIVYLYGYNIGSPWFMTDDEEILHELFLFYVAVTRAKSQLHFYYGNPGRFVFHYVFKEMAQKLTTEQENISVDSLFNDDDMTLFEMNYDSDPWGYLSLKRYKPIRTSEKAVLFVREGESVWVSRRYLGYYKENFYIPEWMAKKNRLSIAV